jgi:hypothetical protein
MTQPISLAPGFSRVWATVSGGNRFNGFGLIVLLLLTSGCATTQPYGQAGKTPSQIKFDEAAVLRQEMLRRELGWTSVSQIKVCPNGHTTVRLIPVIYGFVDQSVIERARRGEVWWGGCGYSAEYHDTERVTCKTCGYGCNTKVGLWDGEFSTPQKCIPPLSGLVTSFPMPAADKLVGSPRFSNEVRRKRVGDERVNYETTENFSALVDRIDQWVRAHGIHADRKVDNNPTQPSATWYGEKTDVSIYSSGGSNELRVSVTHKVSELF